jgi:hypothetical protein
LGWFYRAFWRGIFDFLILVHNAHQKSCGTTRFRRLKGRASLATIKADYFIWLSKRAGCPEIDFSAALGLEKRCGFGTL